jgi:MoaA/NifB/PqqE/SkfB family radical SAM enzyme
MEMGKKFSRQDSSKQTEQFSFTVNINDILIRNLGEDFRRYRERFERAAAFMEEPEYPIHIDFETIFGCNLRCVMCTHAHKDRYPQRQRLMDIGLYKRIIDEGTQFGLVSIGLDQEGEPLLVSNLLDYICYAKQKGILDIMINTNATLLDKEKTEALLHSGLTRIHFSLDAIKEETYNKIRIGSNFSTVMDNILNFCKRKKELKKELPITRVSFVKMKDNEEEMDDFIAFWTKNVDAIAIQEYNFAFPDSSELNTLYSDKKLKNTDFKCAQPWFRVVVLTDGTVLPCCLLGSSLKMALGNVYAESVYNLWNSDGVKVLRSLHREGNFHKHRVCRVCAQNFL